ncbi:Uncharacterised protein [Mycobacteroides abscessus subsp. abscessus]|nr:Uncharacterised protein [Mycobacteroides abscessus subsp. abscessus]
MTPDTGHRLDALTVGAYADRPHQFARARDGREPAESLTPRDRRQLMTLMVKHWRWTDTEIARHTKWTPYTVARIRDGLNLAPNKHERS